MRLPATKYVIFNAAAGLVGVAALVAAVRSVLIPPTATPCSERYNHMTAFSLERGGIVLTAADLQASLGGRDVGVMDNVVIANLQNAPTPVAMGVSLQKAAASAQGDEPRSGVAFPWAPRALQAKAQACLSYHVMFPSGFDFLRGGALPGIGGSQPGDSRDAFLVRLGWRPKGVLGATVRVTENGASRALPVERENSPFPRGKWVKLEQEIALNTPGKIDGALRVWMDGTLVIDRADLSFRARPDVAISDVAVEVFAGTGADDPQSDGPAKIWVTPLEVRWP